MMFGILFIPFLLIAILTTVFWLWMLVDCLTSSIEPMEKLVWVLVIIFLHFIGALLYYVIGRSGRARVN